MAPPTIETPLTSFEKEHIERCGVDLGLRQHRSAQVHPRVVLRVGQVVVGEANDGPSQIGEARDVHRLADEEALRLPVKWQRPREVDADSRRRDDRQNPSASRPHRDRAFPGCRSASLPVPRSRLTTSTVLLAPLVGELAVDKLDAAEADAAREDRRLAERLRVAAGIGRAKIEVFWQAEAGECRGGRSADAVLLAVVVEDIEDVDLFRFGRLRT